MSINFLPDRYSRVTQVTVAVPVTEPVAALTDPSNGHVVLPERVEFTLRRDEGTPRGDRTSAYAAVIGPRRLKSGAAGKPITTIGWETARNGGPRGYVARPDWLTALLAEHLPDGWDPALLELPNRRDAEGDELNPSALVLDAQAYRRLRDTITATMDDPDRWDRDADEGSVLEEYVRWLADGKPARDDGWDDDAPSRTTLPDVLRGAADRIDSEDVPQTAQDTADFIDGARWATGQLRAIAREADASPDNLGWLPDWLTELAREHAASLLSGAERATLRFALELAEERMFSRGNEFSEADHEAVKSLKRLAGGEER